MKHIMDDVLKLSNSTAYWISYHKKIHGNLMNVLVHGFTVVTSTTT
jgi:hypothetical protein